MLILTWKAGSAYFDRNCPLRSLCKIKWNDHPKPANRLPEASLLEGKEALILQSVSRFGKKRHCKLWAKARMLARKRTPRSCGETLKTTSRTPPLGPESGPEIGAGFRPRFRDRIPPPSNNSLEWPESGPRIGAGIRP